MTRRLRFVAVVLALTGMLFGQLAVAAYACPVLGAYLQAGSSASASAGSCCDPASVDTEQPALCRAHCDQGAQAFEKAASAPPVPGPASTPLVVVVGPRKAVLLVGPGEQQSLLARVTAPPVALRHCCLRI